MKLKNLDIWLAFLWFRWARPAYFESKFWLELKSSGGIHKLSMLTNRQGDGRRRSPKCQRYYVSLKEFSKLVNEEGGATILICQGSLWMPPKPMPCKCAFLYFSLKLLNIINFMFIVN